MNADKMQAAANIIMESAIEMLAKVHGCTLEQVRGGIASGHEKLNAQFKQLVEAGIEQAMKMHDAGQIVIA